VTVCIATICNGNMIFGAADKMVTAGDIQFEPPDIKIAAITSSIAVLTAGSSVLHAEILLKLRAEVSYRLAVDPDTWLDVSDIAALYGDYYNEVRTKHAERSLLVPLGLTSDSFIARQQEMSPDFVKQIGAELINFNPGTIEAIITGVDNTGPHIWTIWNEQATCYDRIAFVAIGKGEWHAKSQFMLARYARFWEMPEALLLTYTAKKRAEVAPGVGTDTDMFYIGPRLGSFTWVGDHVIDRLEAIYQNVRQQEAQIVAGANTEVNQYAQELAEAATAKEQTQITEDGGGDTSADKRQLRDGVEEGEPKVEDETGGGVPGRAPNERTD
jgi:hypothetical protein